MSLHDDRIPHLLARVDLVELVGRLGGTEAKRSGESVTFHCPHPGHEDRNPSFTVKGPRWKCWSVCAAGGDAIDLLVWLKGCTKAEAIEELASLVGLDRRERALPPAPDLLRWCAGRGWGPHVVEALGLSIVVDDYGRPRVRFPFRLAGAVPYHQDRAMTVGGRFRWLSPKGGRPIPYEADRMALAAERGHVFIVEGVTDTAALVDVYSSPAVVGVPGVGAWRPSWAAAFAGLSVYVVADNDEAGADFRATLAADLSPVARDVCHVRIPAPFNDLAAWRARLDAGAFDEQMMATVEAESGRRVEMAA